MLYPSMWKKITVDQSKSWKIDCIDCCVFFWATRYYIYSSIHPTFFLFFYLPIYLYIFTSTYLFINPSIYPSIPQSAHLSDDPFIHLSTFTHPASVFSTLSTSTSSISSILGLAGIVREWKRMKGPVKPFLNTFVFFFSSSSCWNRSVMDDGYWIVYEK